jgi:hypothetical protein
VPSSPSIRPTPRTTTTPFMPSPDPIPRNPGGHHRQRRHRRRRALRPAGLRARPRRRSSAAIRSISRPRRADAAGAHLQRSVLAAPERGSPGARGAHGDRRRRPQALAHVPSRHDPLGGAAALRAGPARAFPAAPTKSPSRSSKSSSRFMPPTGGRARATSAARSISTSRAQDRAQIGRHRRSRDHAAAAGIAPADRGIHDPRQRRRRGNAASGRACR